ncbi:MAG: PAS domain S-box protein [Desulfomonilaceae bacterium]|jgi:PAS domain S-box-containing protein
MQDHDKTKDQLIDELNELRRKVAELDAVQKSFTESESRYREIVDKTSEGIFVIQDGLIRFENQACQDISGYRFGDWSFSSLTDLIVHPEDREMVDRYHTDGVRGETVPSLYEFRIVSKDGTTKWMRMNTSGIMWGGEPASFSVITDISERK